MSLVGETVAGSGGEEGQPRRGGREGGGRRPGGRGGGGGGGGHGQGVHPFMVMLLDSPGALSWPCSHLSLPASTGADMSYTHMQSLTYACILIYTHTHTLRLV